MLDRYSVSSCHQREKNTRIQRHSRATGPAPSWVPCSNADRNIAKFSDTRLIPTSSEFRHSSLTISSMLPLGEWGERRIRSRDTPLAPHGTSDNIATTCPSSRTASTSRQSPSAGSPSRPRAMEKPRSSSVSRQASARVITSVISSALSSRCLRIRTATPARRALVTAWRTPRISGPDNRNSSVCRMASSPSCNALSPAPRKACAPAALAPITPGAHP